MTSPYEDIDAALDSINELIGRMNWDGDSINSALSAIQAVYDALTGPIDSFMFLATDESITSDTTGSVGSVSVLQLRVNRFWSNAVIAFADSRFDDLYNIDEFRTAIASGYDATKSATQRQIDENNAMSITPGLKETGDDIADAAAKIPEVIQQATSPMGVILIAILAAAILTLRS